MGNSGRKIVGFGWPSDASVPNETKSAGAYITKEHRGSSRKIDLATAAIIAHDRATDHKPTQSIYETRGMLVI
jgi:hypothetical protein